MAWLLGDMVEKALGAIGLTKESLLAQRMASWFGKLGCPKCKKTYHRNEAAVNERKILICPTCQVSLDCGCNRRKEKLNQLSFWAKQSERLSKEQAEKYLETIIKE